MFGVLKEADGGAELSAGAPGRLVRMRGEGVTDPDLRGRLEREGRPGSSCRLVCLCTAIYFLCFPPFFALCLGFFFGQPVTFSFVLWSITAPSWATSSVGIVSVPALQRLAPLAVRAE